MDINNKDNSKTNYLGLAGSIANVFIASKLTPLIILGSVLLGIGAVLFLPREEEPQIKVPMVDVMVAMPGSSAKEVEERVTRPMEKLLWEIPGIEYVYSTSQANQSLVIARFKVGEDPDLSLLKLSQKLSSNFDRIPPGVSFPLIKSHSIDDVPILALTLHSNKYDHYMLRRVAAQIEDNIKSVSEISETKIIGGARRQIQVLFDPVLLAARDLSPASIVPILKQNNKEFSAGELTTENSAFLVETGGFLRNKEDVESIVVGSYQGKAVYLKDVASIKDGPEELSQYVMFGNGPRKENREEEPAVTITVAKRPGSNAIEVAKNVLKKVESLKGRIIPSEIKVDVTRHYGKTAEEKSDELLLHMLIAVISVSLLIWFSLGKKESLIVALAIPSTLSLTLLVFYLYGFTLNRITLFALIFSIGILVDDAIVVIENIVRHLHMPKNKGRSVLKISIEAVSEVGNPTILATFAVIFAVVPMAFVGGLMGPYMKPIPIGASAAMLFSLLIAFIVTPWAALKFFKEDKRGSHSEHQEEDWSTKFYRKIMSPIIEIPKWRNLFLSGITLLLILAMSLVAIGFVKVKMLPFDNKSEFQVILNMPEGSSLEETTRVAREMAKEIRNEPEIENYQVYSGISSPFNFNGLVRHYFLRQGANVADIQINLVDKHNRSAQSHEIAKRIRSKIEPIANAANARIAVAEVPPGPPVLQTLVAEVYGPSKESRLALAKDIRKIMKSTKGVVDVDWYVSAPQQKIRLEVNKEKAAQHGISTETIAQTLHIALHGQQVEILHKSKEKEDLPIIFQLPRELRSTAEDLLSLQVRSGDANALPEKIQGQNLPLIPLSELVNVSYETVDQNIYHKNLMPVTYVIADVAGEIESPVYAILEMNKKIAKLNPSDYAGSEKNIEVFNGKMPFSDFEPSMKWDGEWHITIEVFRDLGLAFGVVLILIYILMVGWFHSFLTPLIVMVAIPFSLVGILPAHGTLGAFFTATSMIGFMAGAGIVVRNSIILVDFIELKLQEGMAIDLAVIEAGALRFRPMLLTALAVIVGASVILFDPIFQGLAISLMAGEVASLLISRMAVPVLYYLTHKNNYSKN